MMVLKRGVAGMVLGILVPLLLAPTASAAQPADDAPMRCFRLHGEAALRACQEIIRSSRRQRFAPRPATIAPSSLTGSAVLRTRSPSTQNDPVEARLRRGVHQHGRRVCGARALG